MAVSSVPGLPFSSLQSPLAIRKWLVGSSVRRLVWLSILQSGMFQTLAKVEGRKEHVCLDLPVQIIAEPHTAFTRATPPPNVCVFPLSSLAG